MDEQTRQAHGSNDVVLSMTSSIVAAYLTRNRATADAVPQIITSVFDALNGLGDKVSSPLPPIRSAPAVPISKSVTADYLICLEDGVRLKMLKRHLRTVYGLTPDQYRAKWGLPHDYPMVASSYASRRSDLARTSGLGKKRRKKIRLVK